MEQKNAVSPTAHYQLCHSVQNKQKCQKWFVCLFVCLLYLPPVKRCGLCWIPAAGGWTVGYALDKSPLHQTPNMNRQRTSHTHIHTYEKPTNYRIFFHPLIVNLGVHSPCTMTGSAEYWPRPAPTKIFTLLHVTAASLGYLLPLSGII